MTLVCGGVELSSEHAWSLETLPLFHLNRMPRSEAPTDKNGLLDQPDQTADAELVRARLKVKRIPLQIYSRKFSRFVRQDSNKMQRIKVLRVFIQRSRFYNISIE